MRAAGPPVSYCDWQNNSVSRKTGGSEVDHDLTQEELGQLIGAARETINVILNDFSQRGWIRLGGNSILITDSERLFRRARSTVVAGSGG